MKNLNILFVIVFMPCLSVFGQGIHNYGAQIEVSSGAYITVENGGYLNASQGTYDGSIDLDGAIQIDGDFTNNADAGNVFVNRDTDGEVIFYGTGIQTIGGSGEYIYFERVTVNSGSQTQIPNDKAASVNGVLTVNGELQLLSPADAGPSGSLITYSSIDGTGTITVNRTFNTANRWQYISIPMANIQSDQLTEDPNPGYLNPNFYTMNEASGGVDPGSAAYSEWDNITDAWISIQPTIGVPQPLNSGTGYIFYHTHDVTTAFETSTGPADLSTGDKSLTVQYTDNDNGGGIGFGNYFDGWNIVGNPYPSAIDISQLNLAGYTYIDPVIYYWDGVNENYVYYGAAVDIVQGGSQTLNGDGTQYIPAMQSFVLHVTNPDADDTQPLLEESFNIPNNARTHASQNLWKNSAQETPDFSYIKLEASTELNNFTDETIVRFFPGASANFEGSYDALKMYSLGEETPQLYSLGDIPELPLAIGTFPEENLEETTIPLGFKSPIEGNYTISVQEINFPYTEYVFLYDMQEDTYTNLKETDTYSFTSEAGDNRDRFYLFAGDNEPTQSQTPIWEQTQIWAQQRTVSVRVNNLSHANAEIIIYDMLGRPIKAQHMNSNLERIFIPHAEGIYIVNVNFANGQSKTEKVYISNN